MDIYSLTMRKKNATVYVNTLLLNFLITRPPLMENFLTCLLMEKIHFVVGFVLDIFDFDCLV